MTEVLSSSAEREAGAYPAWHDCAATQHGARHHPLQCCCVLAMLVCSVARADDGAPGTDSILGWQHVQASDLGGMAAGAATAGRGSGSSAEHNGPPPGYSPRIEVTTGAGPDDDAPGLAAIDSDTERMRYGPRRILVHVDDITTASGFVDSRVRTMALALDAVVPHAGGLTIQPRVQLAYQPGNAATGTQAPDMLGDSSATGFGVRVYGAQPTRLAGVYPFVEADWWQDSRKQTINVSGTKIDTDLLRGLFSFNIGAHGNTASGMKLWFKVKAGRNAGGTVGARYRW
ncbi:hypothetical protein LMG31506_01492 [Cupriavidus yeoncheonensis]|uniref:Uncharacterized protein n=2 Tax=Cupriavidus yeoncheonensis TaxID=1462994 RepID=A0A916ISY6_9BURK|nr:autotransporter domain-containing protein [Cupriavidus yeoncheonensis]CAG2135104.1 hypothetical protein LMG31506_01492 [Cupriavidus yeoncheonensis]